MPNYYEKKIIFILWEIIKKIVKYIIVEKKFSSSSFLYFWNEMMWFSIDIEGKVFYSDMNSQKFLWQAQNIIQTCLYHFYLNYFSPSKHNRINNSS